MSFAFWQRWLFTASVAFAAFGLVAAFFPFAPLFALRNEAIAAAFFGGTWTSASAAYHAFSAGPLGG
ncbi:MAG: hypothetical protein ACR2GR_01410 [Rhodothermales bacterium]